MAMLRGAIVDERAVEQLRAGLVASMLIGVTLGRRIVGVPVLADADVDVLVATVAPAVQVVLTDR